MDRRGDELGRSSGRIGLGACLLALGTSTGLLFYAFGGEDGPGKLPIEMVEIPGGEVGGDLESPTHESAKEEPAAETSAPRPSYTDLLAGLEADTLDQAGAQDLAKLALSKGSGASAYEDKVSAYGVATRAAVASENANLAAYAHWKLGLVHLDEQQLETARKTFEAGLASAGEDSPGLAPWLQLDLATIARKQERYHDATRFCDLAIAGVDVELFHRQNHDALLADAYGGHFRIQQSLGNLDKAGEWLTKQEAAAAVVDEPVVASNVILNKVSLYMTTGDYGLAHAEIVRVLAPESQAKLTSRARSELEYKQPRAAASLHQFDREQGVPFEVEAHELLLSESTPKTLRLAGLSQSSQLYLGWGLLDMAEQRLDEADQQLSEMSGDMSLDGLNSEAASLVIARSVLIAAQLNAAVAAGDEVQVEHLRELLASRAALTKANFDALLAVWSRTPLTTQGVGFAFVSQRSKALSGWIGLQRDHESCGGPEAAFDSLMAIQSMGSQARRMGLAPTDLPEIQNELLSPGEGLAIFRLAIGGSFLFLVDEQGLYSFELPEAKPLRKERDRLVRHLTRPPARDESGAVKASVRNSFRERSQALGAELFPPAAQEIIASWSALTIVAGDSTVGWIPFEALEFEGLGPIGMRMPMAHFNSIPTGLELARQVERRAKGTKGNRSGELLLVGTPVHSEGVQDRWPSTVALVWEGEMAAQFERAGGGREVRLALGSAASSDALSDESLNGVSVLELLCHGLYDRSRAHPAVLALSPSPGLPDGLLGYEAILELSSPPIVILAACSAAKAPRRPGEDAGHSLSSAWLQAGAEVVLLSPADLDYASTWSLSLALQEALAEGQSPAEALLHARRLVAKTPGFNHPYYHSLLRPVGLGHKPGK